MEEKTKVINIAATVVLKNDHGDVLLMQREHHLEKESGKWENPGGALHFGEHTLDTVTREVNDNLGIKLGKEDFKQLFADSYIAEEDGKDIHWQIVVYEATIGQDPTIKQPVKYSAIGWFSIDELDQVPLTSYTRADFFRIGWVKHLS
jgi:ADP-ribose pyrophosphatase YjhB (NUDIX family)